MDFFDRELNQLTRRYAEHTAQQSPALTDAALLGDIQVRDDVPHGELWLVENLGPIARAAGLGPRVLGRITNIGQPRPELEQE